METRSTFIADFLIPAVGMFDFNPFAYILNNIHLKH